MATKLFFLAISFFSFFQKKLMPSKLLTVNFELKANKSSYTFPNDNLIEGKRVTAIWIRETVAGALASDGQPLISNADLQKGFLTLKSNGDEQVHDVPLRYFSETQDCSCKCPLLIESFNAQQSHVNFPTAPTADTTLEMVLCYEAASCS